MKIFGRAFAGLVGGTVASQLIVLAVAPLLSRLYSPSEFGVYGIVIGIAAVVASLGTGRLEHAIPVAASKNDAARIYVLGAGLALCATLVMGLTGMLSWLLLGHRAGWLTPGAVLSAMAVAFSLAVFQLSTGYLTFYRAYRVLATNKFVQGIGLSLGQVALGALGAGAAGLSVGLAIGYLFGSALGLRTTVRRVRLIARRRRLRLRSALTRHRGFPLVLAPAAALNLAAQNLPVVAISMIYGVHEAGLLAFVLRMCGGPMGVIGQAVGSLYSGSFKELSSASADQLNHTFTRLVRMLLLIGLPFVAAMVLALEFAGAFVFGEAWAPAGAVALALSPFLLGNFISNPMSMTLAYLGRYRTQLNWDLMRLAMVVLVFAVVWWLEWEFHACLWLLSTCWFASLVLHLQLSVQALEESAQAASQAKAAEREPLTNQPVRDARDGA